MIKYQVTGNVEAELIERDEYGDRVKVHHGRGVVSTAVVAISPELATDVALSIWARENDWPLDCVEWACRPQVIKAPEDQQMMLAGAPMLPGLE